jgi:hypothetical protein
MKLVYAVFISGLAALSPVKAQAFSGNDLLQQCEVLAGQITPYDAGRISVPLTFTNGECWGYFDAVWGLSRLASGRQRLLGICTPPRGDETQFIRIFIQYARSHPERLHEDAELLTMTALMQAFPCR